MIFTLNGRFATYLTIKVAHNQVVLKLGTTNSENANLRRLVHRVMFCVFFQRSEFSWDSRIPAPKTHR